MFFRKEFIMKKLFINTIILLLLLLCSCKPTDNSSTSSVTEDTAAKTTISDTNIETSYFTNHEQIDDTILFIPETKDFCIQIPADAHISKLNNNYNILIHDTIRITMTVSEHSEYTPMTSDELTAALNSMRDDEPPVTVNDLSTITENNVEIGRSYAIDYGSGVKDYITEKLQNDGELITVRTSSIPFIEYTPEKETELLKYYNSLEII